MPDQDKQQKTSPPPKKVISGRPGSDAQYVTIPLSEKPAKMPVTKRSAKPPKMPVTKPKPPKDGK